MEIIKINQPSNKLAAAWVRDHSSQIMVKDCELRKQERHKQDNNLPGQGSVIIFKLNPQRFWWV